MIPLVRLMPLLAVLVAVTSSCRVLPVVDDKPVSIARSVPASGPLVTASRNLAAGRAPKDSSFLLLDDAGEALSWRLALIDSATSSIDIQLYLWHGGSSSVLLFERLLQAADRGVRVRLLVDDFLMTAREGGLATLSRNHPNFEIRIFNPTRIRGSSLGAMAEMVANFRILNRRMHNKTFTADRCLTIVGGRNIGDHYYGMDEDYNFIDLDVLVAGPVVADVSDGFDEFWNSTGAYPGEYLSRKNRPDDVTKAREEFRAAILAEKDSKLRDFPTERYDWRRELSGLKRSMVTGRAQFLQDHPEPGKDTRQVVTGLASMTESARGSKDEIVFATPYLLPSDKGIKDVGKVTAGGTEVRVLVPTLGANNHAVVNGHYHHHRKPLMNSGAEISEMRADPTEEVRALADVAPVRSERVTLHLKALVGNRTRCFIGSLNLDPRAVAINTESGLLIDSPALAGELADLIKLLSNDQNSWKVSYDERGRVQWESRGEVIHRPPPAKWSHRLLSWFSGLLPIKDQI